MPTPMPPKGPATSMPDASPMAKIGIIGLVGLIVGFVVGYGMGRVSTGSPVNPLDSKSGSYQDGYNAAKQKLTDSGLFPPGPTEMKMLSGPVKSIDKNSFTFDANLGAHNPLDESSAPVTRTVTVSASTKITRQVSKAPDEFLKELTAFQKTNDPSKQPPQPFTVVTIKLSELKVGDSVVVAADHNILNEAAFTATEVTLGGSAAATAPIAPPIPAK